MTQHEGKLILRTRFDPGVLNLHATSACNLNCAYCFLNTSREKEIKPARQMTLDTAIQALEMALHSRSKSDGKLAVHFLGGEPLMNYKLITEFSRHLAENSLRDRVVLTLTTNGTLLTPERAAQLKEEQFKIFLSIDSQSAAEQDALRPLINGKGSSDQVQKSLALLRGYPGLTVQITMTGVQEDLLGTIVSHVDGGTAVKLSICMVPGRQEGPLMPSVNRIALVFDGFVDRLSCQNASFDRLNVHPLRSIAAVLVNKTSFGMCGGGTSSISVGSDGRLYPCDPFVGHDEYAIGSVGEGIDEAKRLDFVLTGLNRLKDECKGCRYGWICGGGCTAFSAIHQDRPDKVDRYYCSYIAALVESMKKLVKYFAAETDASMSANITNVSLKAAKAGGRG